MAGRIEDNGEQAGQPSASPAQQSSGAADDDRIVGSLDASIGHIEAQLGRSTDLIVRRFELRANRPHDAALIYIEGISDTQTVLASLSAVSEEQADWEDVSGFDAEAYVRSLLLPVGTVGKTTSIGGALQALLTGDAVVLFDGLPFAVTAGTRKWKDRAIEEPATEAVIRGPRDGFTETLRTNTGLVRRRVKDPNLWMETMQIGTSTRTDVAIMYLNGTAAPDVIKRVRDRLNEIDTDSVLESGYIEEYIQDRKWSLFPTVFSSERPDVIAAELLEGRVAIFVDGTPFVSIVPAVFMKFLQASEDYYQRADFATFIRIIRYASLFITLLAPALYIAITTFHHELLPPELLMSLAAAREGVPFPAFIEAVLMELTFEILREAGVRMPRTIGQAISIVGTLVIGQASVEAGLVSPAMVIVVSITAISNFVLPAFNIAISFRILRFFMMALAASLGIFGILLGLFAMVFHLCSLQSVGVPYLSGFAPFHGGDQKDAILRLPLWMAGNRPSDISRQKRRSQQAGSKAPTNS